MLTEEQRIKRNLDYISTNKLQVIATLKNKSKLKVCFYVYDETKWKCQSIYDQMIDDELFEPLILVTRTNVEDIHNSSYQPLENLEKVYNFFKNKNMNVEYAYRDGFIPFEQFSPDIIIYQHPWYVETLQGPVVCSKFALTCYVPYYFPTTTAPIDYYLRFHKYVEKYYVFDEITKTKYEEKEPDLIGKLEAVGQPFFDYFLSAKDEDKKYTIYAPHWSVCGKSVGYSTFEWSGKFMLEFARKNPEYNWIFKPHPLLKKALVDNNLFSQKEVDAYYDSWKEFGIKYESGDYLDIFNKSKLLVTDCSSFLGEYFMTKSPVIHLLSANSIPFNETVEQVIKHYYKAHNLSELENLLRSVLQDDYMKQERIQALDNLGYLNNCASINIIKDIKDTIYG